MTGVNAAPCLSGGVGGPAAEGDLEHHAELLRGGVWRPRVPNWRDLVALFLFLALLILLGSSVRQMLAPLAVAQHQDISLSPLALPNYALRTTVRMLAALIASLLFTLVYGTLAAKKPPR